MTDLNPAVPTDPASAAPAAPAVSGVAAAPLPAAVVQAHEAGASFLAKLEALGSAARGDLLEDLGLIEADAIAVSKSPLAFFAGMATGMVVSTVALGALIFAILNH